jgi:excinuclease ABC subunit C
LEDYNEGVDYIKNILKGNLAPVIQHFKLAMSNHIHQLEFEKAEIIKKKLDHLQNYKAKSTIVNERTGTVDVFSILEEGDIAYVNYLAVNNGSIVLTKTITLKKKLDEPAAEVLSFAIAQLRETFNSEAKEIILPFSIEYHENDITQSIPQAGDKKKLLDLSEKNVNYFKEELKKNKMLLLEDKTSEQIMEVLKQLQNDLQLSSIPTHIECFDNSNFQGSFPVSAMVCFKNGLPSKNDFRRFNVKTVIGINDFATMSEVVYRRYKKLEEEQQAFPHLVIIDGGKGQLSAAMDSIKKLKLEGKTTLVGLAKNEEEIFFYGDKQSIKLPWGSESLKLIRRIRDEVHRYGITYHRNLRSKGSLINELDQIEGVGKATIELLLKKFKSVKKVKAASTEEITAVVGISKASLIRKFVEQQLNK